MESKQSHEERECEHVLCTPEHIRNEKSVSVSQFLRKKMVSTIRAYRRLHIKMS